MASLHERAKDIFIAALGQPLHARGQFLAEACEGDSALQSEVESLLAFHDEQDDETAAAGSGPVEAHFRSGEVFAGRYRMIARLGRGGMGDVWSAEDLVLRTEVALKLITSTSDEARERMLHEVRVARQITHPSVCRVFDVGEADEGVFLSMELVRGEDLAALLRRVGRLPSEKVIDIAWQLCAGLAAAHQQGVLHRDLKPANVMIDDSGAVRITDFGIALSRDEMRGRSSLTGTPAYMAPEQRTASGELSERTDIYAVGVLLYELLVGHHPFAQAAALGSGAGAGATELPAPVKPSALVANVHPGLERLILEALAPDPAARPGSSVEMVQRLAGLTAPTRPRTTRRGGVATPRKTSPLIGGVVVVVLVLIAMGGVAFWSSTTAGTLSEQDTIVLADLENRTGDPVFDGALKVALAVSLEQSPFLKVFPDDRARDTLRLMERDPDERITRSIAREIARREQLKALIAGSIASLGHNYVIALEAVNAETADVMAREQAEAGSKEEVLTSLGAAASRLRSRLGESLSSIQKFDVPLPRATTPSLEALHAYALALDEGRAVPRLEAEPHLTRAIELDPDFAMAHAQLAAVYANTGQSALAPTYAKRAFELRDHVSERERYFISWRYYRDAVQDVDKALDLARAWTAAYPREAFASNALGAALLRLGRFGEAIGPLRQAIQLDPKFVPAYSNLAASLIGVDKRDEARAILQTAADRKLDFAGARRLSYLLAFVQGDRDTMSREMNASIGLRETNAAYGWLAHTLAFSGQPRAAHEQFRQGIQMALPGNFKEVAAQLNAEDAEVHAVFGECATALAEVRQGLNLSRDNITLERSSRAVAMCGDSRLVAELTSELERRFPEATLSRRVLIPVARATAALHDGAAARAIELLEPVRPYEHAPAAEFWPAYIRGEAYLRAGNAAAAQTEFKSIVDHLGEVPAATLYPLAHLAWARAAASNNDSATAKREYQAALELWKAADSNVKPLQEARLELARLP
jgi:tetratricopeptide (TPR) repeat protein